MLLLGEVQGGKKRRRATFLSDEHVLTLFCTRCTVASRTSTAWSTISTFSGTRKNLTTIRMRLTVWQNWAATVFNNVDLGNRFRITETWFLFHIDVEFFHWCRDMHVSVVLDHVLLQSSWSSERNVWWARESDRRASDWHSV